jgi:glutamate-1-semialdehyde 2,1-aminomutase
MYPDDQSTSARLYERAKNVIADGVSRSTIAMSPYPLYIARGEGARLWDADGNELIDFNNNYTSLIHGHAQPDITAAVTAQLSKGAAFSFATEAEIELAELLCARAPGIERIRFCNSGSEAVMNVIKAARAYTRRAKIAKCEGAYHGSYDFAEVSLGAGPDHWGDAAAPNPTAYSAGTPQGVLDDVVVIPFNDAAAAEAILDRHGPELAGVLLDPVSNQVGLIDLDPAFLAMLQRVTKRHGMLLMFDEVIAFRVGFSGAQGALGITPDLTAMGKIIGGGFPVGAVAGRAEVMHVFDRQDGKAPLPHGGTFNANPVTMVAGKTCMDRMDEAAFDRLNALGDLTRARLQEAFALANAEGQVTGRASLFRIHLHSRPLKTYRDAWMPLAEQAAMTALHRHLINAGAFISPTGMGCLSTAMTEADIDRLAEATLAALRRLREDNLLPQ